MRYISCGILVIDTTTGEIVYEAGPIGTRAARTCAGKLNTELSLGILDIQYSVQEIKMMEEMMKFMFPGDF
jgi:hypothetical protein